MALAHQSSQPGTAEKTLPSAYLTVQHSLLAACVVLAPLVIALSFVPDPTHGVPRSASDIFIGSIPAALALLKRPDEGPPVLAHGRSAS